MQIIRSMRATALLAAALTLAACGSDKAAGPTTANNAQIIAEMKAAVDSGGITGIAQFLGLQAAISGLSAGAPVNSGSLTVDGQSYRFSTTSLTMESRDQESSEITSRTTIVVGWRATNGDSLFIAIYGPDPENVLGDRRAPVDLAARSETVESRLAGVSAMLKSGRYTVSKTVAISGGPDHVGMLLLQMGDQAMVAGVDDGITAGSISYTPTSGECTVESTDGLLFGTGAESCELQRSNASFTANTTASDAAGGSPTEGPVVTLPAQTVVGVKLLSPPI